jgi:hypothetical protein
MGSFNANILPATTGLALGSVSQQWIGYLSNAFAGTIQSSTINAALSGVIRLANTDTIAWRNAANSADISLADLGASTGNLPADVLQFNGGGLQGTFISSTANPAATGIVRLGSQDAINFRDAADTADVNGISTNSGDQAVLGGTQGAVFSGPVSGITTLGVGGISISGNAVVSGNAAVSGNETVGGTFGVTGDSTLAGVTAQWVSAATLSLSGAITGANGFSPLVGNGAPLEVAAINLSGQTAAIAAATLAYTTVTAGQYRVSWNSKVTTAAGSSSTLGTLTIFYNDVNDPIGIQQTITCGAQTSAGAIATTTTGNSNTSVLLGIPMLLNCRAATGIYYSFAYVSSPANAMVYNLNIEIEAM